MEANLGSTIRAIDAALPSLLRKCMPSHIVDPNIALRVLPEQLHLVFRGAIAYRAMQAVVHAGVTPWLLPRGTTLCALRTDVSREKNASDRRYEMHWISVLPTARPPRSTLPGRPLISHLGLLPEEYPVLMGSFEFAFTLDCLRIAEHTVRNVEYIPKPVEPSVCL